MLCFLVGLLVVIGGVVGVASTALGLGCIANRVVEGVWWEGLGDTLLAGLRALGIMMVLSALIFIMYMIGCGILPYLRGLL